MLNVSSPAPLFDDQDSHDFNFDNNHKRNTSMIQFNEPASRPTLNQPGIEEEEVNENLSFEETKKTELFSFKIILIGSVSVGKTSIINRYVLNEYNEVYSCTLKVDFKTKIMNINNMVKTKLTIFDTTGDEKFRAITRQYYKDAQGVLLVYDVTNRNSFNDIAIWERDIKDNAPADTVIFLVGNKSDLTKERVVTYEEGKNKANELGLFFTEVSAKSGDNIHILFENISESMLKVTQNKPLFQETRNNSQHLENMNKDNKDVENKKKLCC